MAKENNKNNYIHSIGKPEAIERQKECQRTKEPTDLNAVVVSLMRKT